MSPKPRSLVLPRSSALVLILLAVGCSNSDSGSPSGLGAVLGIEPGKVDIGEVPVGYVGGRAVKVTNEGSAELVIDGLRVESLTGTFTAFPDRDFPIRLRPLAEAFVLVSFAPQLEGRDSAKLVFLSNAGDKPLRVVRVVGLGVHAPPPVAMMTTPLGTLVIPAATTDIVAFDIPPDTTSFMLVAHATNNATGEEGAITIGQVTDPTGRVIHEFQPSDPWGSASPIGKNSLGVQLLRSTRVLVLPSNSNETNPTFPLETGSYEVVVANNEIDDASVEVSLTTKSDPDERFGRLDVNLVTVGDDLVTNKSSGVGAAVFALFKDLLRQVLAVGGIAVEFHEVVLTGPAASQLTFLDLSTLGIENVPSSLIELNALLAQQLSPSAASDRVNFYIVRNLFGPGAVPIGGISIGIPGPLGTDDPLPASGAIVSLQGEDFAGLVADLPFSEQLTRVVAGSAMELTHYLGLFHTSEAAATADPAEHDPLADTPECVVPFNSGDPGAAFFNCFGFGAENVQFWAAHEAFTLSGLFFLNPFTPQQRYVMNRYPFVK